MIEVQSLTKTFLNGSGDLIPAVDHVTFTAKPGEIFGLLGPNGAGKTTTLRILCTVLKPTDGFAKVAGFDVVQQAAQVRSHIGFLSNNTGVYDRMTAWEMVEYYGRLHGLNQEVLKARQEELFKTLQMNDFRDVLGADEHRDETESLDRTALLIHDPPVLIFDEPTSGLDILVQRAVLQNIASLRGGESAFCSQRISVVKWKNYAIEWRSCFKDES